MSKQLSFIFFIISIFILLSQTSVESAPTQTVFIQLSNTDAVPTNALSQVQYGRSNWIELPANSTILSADGIQPADFTLHLGGRSFDPLTLPITNQRSTTSADFHLIQLIGPTKQNWLEQLTAHGATPLQYIHPYTYVVWADGATMSQLTARSAVWPFIRWHGAFAPEYRLTQLTNNLDRLSTNEMQSFNVLIYRGQSPETIASEITALGGVFTTGTILTEQWQLAHLQLPAEQVTAAAALPGVYTIQSAEKDGGTRSEFSALINIGQHNTSYTPSPGYLTWLSEQNLSGAGVIVSVVDEGVDANHPDLANRMANCTGTTCSNISSLHGSHTAGIIAADGSSGITDQFGFLRGLGIAPQATLIEQRYFDETATLYDIASLMTDSSQNQAVISSNSWGPSSRPQGYDIDTMMVDVGVRDADTSKIGYQPLTYIVAIMNGFGGYQSQGSPDEAKNAITVGSTENRQLSGLPSTEINNISNNSAHGPALDGRTLPLIVAPGSFVDSTAENSGYQYLVGTSMAAPQVSGAAALFVDYYRQQFTADPSPALIKAALLPVTHSLISYQDADGRTITERFGSTHGWGRLDLAAVVDPQTAVLYYDSPTIFEDSGESWSLQILAQDPEQPVKMMLVWTDAAGHGLGGNTPAWNNNLDLQLATQGQTYYANNFDAAGWSVTTGTPDERHNTEAIFLQPSQTNGLLEITITATNLNSDGLPEQGDMVDQDFAFVCYNCRTMNLTQTVSLPLIFQE